MPYKTATSHLIISIIFIVEWSVQAAEVDALPIETYVRVACKAAGSYHELQVEPTVLMSIKQVQN